MNQIDRGGAGTGGPPSQMLRWLLTLFVIAAALALAWLANRLPAPAPDTAPATQFSAERAMKDVRAIAVRPHPIGSAQIEDTRRYLTARMAALGLDPQMRDQTVVVTRRNAADIAIGGRVRNIVGELKGNDPALPAVLLMAHYDTAPLSPGAGDDTAGVAALLEIARALQAGGPLRRSVIFLLTDGEEAGLLGANAFFRDDPLHGRAGVIVNLEARGDSGRALMFQTSPGNRKLIEAYQRNVTVPAADSLMVTIYKQMPNDTDLTAALEQGHAGMNFAFVGHQMAYHTPLSTPERLNSGSIQHMGDQVLPLLRDFAQAESLERGAGDMIFADLFGRYFIAYPATLGWIFALITIGAAFAMTGASLVRGTVGWRDVARGATGTAAILLSVATILMLAQRLIALSLRDIASPYAMVGQFWWILFASLMLGLGTGALLIGAMADGRWRRPALVMIAAGALAAFLGDFLLLPLGLGGAAAALVFAGARRPSLLPGWFAGAVSLVGFLALALQAALPNGAHALVWPLALFLLPLALLLFAPDRALRPASLIAVALAAVIVAGLMARTGYDFFLMIGATLPAVMAPFILLAMLALVPLIWPLRKLKRAAALVTVAGLALCAVAAVVGRTPSAASPELVEAFHIADVDKGRAQWASGQLDKSGWVKAVLTQDGGEPKRESIAPLGKEDYWVARAKPFAFHRPRLDVSATENGKARHIDIRAVNANNGRYMRIFVKPSVDLTGLRLMNQGVPGTLKAGSWSQVIFHASGSSEVHLALTANGPGAAEIRMVEVRDGWPASNRSIPLPPHVIPYRRANDSMIATGKIVKW